MACVAMRVYQGTSHFNDLFVRDELSLRNCSCEGLFSTVRSPRTHTTPGSITRMCSVLTSMRSYVVETPGYRLTGRGAELAELIRAKRKLACPSANASVTSEYSSLSKTGRRPQGRLFRCVSWVPANRPNHNHQKIIVTPLALQSREFVVIVSGAAHGRYKCYRERET